jgi:hypothetical protein
MYGINFHNLAFASQDTTGSSINTFDDVPIVGQIPCFAHLCNLMLKHGIENCEHLRLALISIHECVKLVRGSPKRKKLLQSACKVANIKYKAPILDCDTRWNSNEAMVSRFIHLFPALQRLDVKNAFNDAEKRRIWKSHLERAEEELCILEVVLPLLTLVAQWVQILSQSEAVTISLVLTACQKIHDMIKTLLVRSTELQSANASPKENILGEKLESVLNSIEDQFDMYLGVNYQDFYAFTAGEFLDPRTFPKIDKQNYGTAIKALAEMCTTNEKSSEYKRELIRRKEQQARRSASRRSSLTSLADLDPDLNGDEEENFINTLMEEGPTKVLSRVVPLHEEVTKYLELAGSLTVEARDPMTFWSDNHYSLPILFRIARRILPARPCSTDVERLFSLTGRICAPNRLNMSGHLINKQACLNLWLRSKYGLYDATRSLASKESSKKFISLNLDLSMTSPEGGEEELSSDSESEQEKDEVEA